jgi:SAM-dependent methyltransferase
MGSLTRKLYYALPPAWRLTARWIAFLPTDVWNKILTKQDELVPPRRLIYTGAGDFVRIGKLFLQDLTDHHLVESNSTVLDIGSGIGRIAIPLTTYLENGSYEGFDIMEPGIRWCQQKITARFPHFQFTRVNLANDLYQNTGQPASQFVFPYQDGRFDLAIATSVFTHMLPEEIIRYMDELYRVLKKGGHAYLTFFLLNSDSKTHMQQGGNEFNFRFDHGNYCLLNEKVKSANVAYEERFLTDQLINPSRFKIENIHYGTWSTGEKGSPIAFQDRVIITRL